MVMQSHLTQVSQSGVLGATVVAARDSVPVDHVRRCEATIFDQPAGQKVARETTYRAFAIGAGYVDGLPRELDVVEQTADPLEPRLDHGELSGMASAA